MTDGICLEIVHRECQKCGKMADCAPTYAFYDPDGKYQPAYLCNDCFEKHLDAQNMEGAGDAW